MTETKKIFRCEHCGNIIGMIHNSGVRTVCCGEPMKEIVANTIEAPLEKHIPVIEITGQVINVRVGEVPHPMTEEHYIQWIYLETKDGGQLKYISPNNTATVSFSIVDDIPLVVYAYCNLHGLWKKEMK